MSHRRLLLALTLTASAHCSALTLHYTITTRSYGALLPAFQSGDPGTLSFDLDLSTEDSDPNPGAGLFKGALSNVAFALDAEAAGSYGGGSAKGSHDLILTDNGLDDVLYVGLLNPNFAPYHEAHYTYAVTGVFLQLRSFWDDAVQLDDPVGQKLGDALTDWTLDRFHYRFGEHGHFGILFAPAWIHQVPISARYEIASTPSANHVPDDDHVGALLVCALVPLAIRRWILRRRSAD